MNGRPVIHGSGANKTTTTSSNANTFDSVSKPSTSNMTNSSGAAAGIVGKGTPASRHAYGVFSSSNNHPSSKTATSNGLRNNSMGAANTVIHGAASQNPGMAESLRA